MMGTVKAEASSTHIVSVVMPTDMRDLGDRDRVRVREQYYRGERRRLKWLRAS